jgi:hypothetical protein
MPGANVTWQTSPGSMADRVTSYAKRLLAAVYALATEWASRIANDARSSAPWQDHTGLARRSILGRAFRLAVGAVIVISGGAPYSIYLERKNAGRFAAITPALQRSYAAVFASLQQLIR